MGVSLGIFNDCRGRRPEQHDATKTIGEKAVMRQNKNKCVHSSGYAPETYTHKPIHITHIYIYLCVIKTDERRRLFSCTKSYNIRLRVIKKKILTAASATPNRAVVNSFLNEFN